MAEEILPVDEVESIAKEYVRNRESVEDVEVETTRPDVMARVLMHVVKGKARRKTVDATTWQAGVLETLSFILWISDKTGEVTGYQRELPSPPPPPTSWQPVELIEPMPLRDRISDFLGKEKRQILSSKKLRKLKRKLRLTTTKKRRRKSGIRGETTFHALLENMELTHPNSASVSEKRRKLVRRL